MNIVKTLLACFLMTAACAAAAKSSGGLSGKVTDEQGSPVPRTSVMVTLQPSSSGGPFTPFSATTRSEEDGSFLFTGVPAGTYMLCAENRAGRMLNSCAWAAKPALVTVGDGHANNEANVQLKKGYLLHVALEDKEGLLKQHESQSGHIFVSLPAPDMTVQMPAELTKDQHGRVLTLLVPFDTQVGISVFSDFFTLADEKGNAFTTKGFKVPVQIPTGTAESSASSPSVRLQITGVAAPGDGTR